MRNIEMMNVAFARLWEQGYTITYYGSGDYHSVTLEKYTVGKGKVATSGNGEDFISALSAAVTNFPTNPLDGTIWRTQLLEAPKDDAA